MTMFNDTETGGFPRAVSDELEIDEFTARPAANHEDQYAHHTHELPEDSAEASSRALVRIVPVAYGGLLGGLADNLALGLAGGMALGGAFDLFMGDKSLLRELGARLSVRACPAIATAARLLAALIGRFGLGVPVFLSEVRCGSTQH